MQGQGYDPSTASHWEPFFIFSRWCAKPIWRHTQNIQVSLPISHWNHSKIQSTLWIKPYHELLPCHFAIFIEKILAWGNGLQIVCFSHVEVVCFQMMLSLWLHQVNEKFFISVAISLHWMKASFLYLQSMSHHNLKGSVSQSSQKHQIINLILPLCTHNASIVMSEWRHGMSEEWIKSVAQVLSAWPESLLYSDTFLLPALITADTL